MKIRQRLIAVAVLLSLSLNQSFIISYKSYAAPDPVWTCLNAYEEGLGQAVYNSATDTITFANDGGGWGARMINTGLADLQGKDLAVEFDVNLTGGELVVYPNFEMSGVHFTGVGIDFGAGILDRVAFNGEPAPADDFSYASGYTDTYFRCANIPAVTANRIRIEFRNGPDATLAGGNASVFQKKNGTSKFARLGQYFFPADFDADSADVSNHLVIQLRLGTGNISNIITEELTGAPGPAQWTPLNEAEAALAGAAVYDSGSDSLAFGFDNGWGTRAINTALPDLQGKELAVEFNVTGISGVVTIFPNFEDGYKNVGGVSFSGIGFDIGANVMERIAVSSNIVLDDFNFRATWPGATDPGGPFTTFAPDALQTLNNRIRVEFRNGAGGTLRGGYIKVYQMSFGQSEFSQIGTFNFGDDLTDTDHPEIPNQLLLQIWHGAGTLYDITVEELQGDDPEEDDPPKWEHLNDAEKAVGDALYDPDTDTIRFSGAQEWSSRLINTEIEDISDESFAVEFDADLGSGGAIGISPIFEDMLDFYSVYYDIGGSRIDGVGIMGIVNEKLNVIDDFAYINDSLYPFYPLRETPPEKGSNARFRIESFLGDGGTMAGGEARFYYKAAGSQEWRILGVFIFPGAIIDRSDIPNRVMIHGRLVNGSISNIEVFRDITDPIVGDGSAESSKWGYVSDFDKAVRTASFDDQTGVMTLGVSGEWDARMVSLTMGNTQGKCFALELTANLDFGGALGIIPFYEDAGNWYGVYLDRGARMIAGVGFNGGEVINDFAYVNSALALTKETVRFPFSREFRYRFEFFSNSGGVAGAVCRMYFKEIFAAENELWRFIGEFAMPDAIIDRSGTANRIMIHGRILSGQLSNIVYSEISPDTQTPYLGDDAEEEYEDGYPDDGYTPPKGSGGTENGEDNLGDDDSGNNSGNNTVDDSGEDAGYIQDTGEDDETKQEDGGPKPEYEKVSRKITEYLPVPWWSIALIIVGGALILGLAVFLVLFLKKRRINKT